MAWDESPVEKMQGVALVTVLLFALMALLLSVRHLLSPPRESSDAAFLHPPGPGAVLIWEGGTEPTWNPKCDMTTLWSSRVPVEINDLRDIFGDVLVLPIKTKSDLRKLPGPLRVLMYSSNTHSLDFMQAATAAARPAVIVHLSDEYCHRPDHLHLQAACFVRQYSHQDWAWPSHVLQIPPFAHCWDGAALPPLPFEDRDLQWCFVGNPKNDRKRLCAALAKAMPRNFAGSSDPRDNARRYQRSLLTLSARGDVNLETSRPYSAMRCGCVPIGLGEAWEVEKSFSRFKPRCPLLDLYAPDEESLVELGLSLVSDSALWQRISSSLVRWDASCRAVIRDAVAKAVVEVEEKR